ncbi:MAG: hypothetical protein GX208_06645 [Firmicutes bacterium]|nr:hypothetical protein [Bacillota bacterium]
MGRQLRRLIIVAIIGLVWYLGIGVPSLASVPYPSFSFDAWGQRVVAPAPYEPIRLIDGYDIMQEDPWSLTGFSIVPLSQPQGLAVDSQDHLYIADTGNNRIVQYDQDFNFVRTIGDSSGKGRLSRPRGVFVDQDGLIYVADTGNSRVAVFSEDGEFVKDYGRPGSQVFGSQYRFAPISVAVDRRGTLYVATEGGYRGLVQISPLGQFMGFLGGNKAGFDLLWLLKQWFFTEEQLSREARRLPGSPGSVVIDDKGLVYTATISTNHAQIKRFNLGGINTLPEKDYGDPFFRAGTSMFTGIAVDSQGLITTVDANTGQIFQYTPNGDLLFVFGGRGLTQIERLGVINQAAGIAIRYDGLLLVSDLRSNNVHVFQPTEFATLVHQAVHLFEDGRYSESAVYWSEVLRRNANYDLAQRGLGMAAYQNEDYHEAIKYFELAQDAAGYSDAFWWVRRAWLLENLSNVIIVVVIIWVLHFLVQRLWLGKRPKYKRDWYQVNRLLGDLMYSFKVITKPVDGFYDIRWGKKGSILAAWIIIFLAFATKIFTLYYTSLIFMSVDRNRINLVEQALTFVLPWLIWVVAHYLISSLKAGEGRFRDVFIGSAYAMVPYIIIMIPLTIISNLLTGYEATVYTFFQNVSILWCGLLFFIMVFTIHNYEIWEAIPTCILSVLMMVVISALGGLVIGLTFNVTEFATALYKEVIYRVF